MRTEHKPEPIGNIGCESALKPAVCDCEALQGREGESGQAAIYLVVLLSTIMIAIGFGVDLTNMWFHRQAAQTAADAGCQAGALDMLSSVGGVSNSGNFTPGVASNCVSTPNATICKYAGFNGFSGSGYTSSTSGSTVSWTFPSSVPNVTAPPSGVTSNPFMKVTVAENVKTWFMNLAGINHQVVAASSTCGLTPVKAAPPLVVLNPSLSQTVYEHGTGTIAVVGGPQRSLQVNSSNSAAINIAGAATLDFSQAGPNYTGGDLGVTGGPSTSPGGYLGGTTGNWLSPTSPLPDPYATVPAPPQPAACTYCTGKSVPHFWDACPDSNGCVEYSPGYYPSGIAVKGGTAIFLPGLYYLGADLTASSNSTLRNGWTFASTVGPVPAPSPADGVMFYFTNGAGVAFGANSGSSTIDSIPSSYVLCNPLTQSLPSQVPSTLNGSFLWSQCTVNGTYDNYANTGSHYPDTESTSGSRGLLMFVDHTLVPDNLHAGGGGSIAFGGTFYFHLNNNFTDLFTLQGGSGTGTIVIGKIVTDELDIGGNGAITMALSTDQTVSVVKAGTFQ